MPKIKQTLVPAVSLKEILLSPSREDNDVIYLFIKITIFMKSNRLFMFAILLIICSIACQETPKKEETGKIANPETTSATTPIPENSLIQIGQSVGQVMLNMTQLDLIKIFGKDRLTIDTVYEAEGTVATLATFIDREKPSEIIVLWDEKKHLTKIDRIQVWNPQSPFKTADGLHVGSSLAEVEKMNGKTIAFQGFGWDYGGGANFQKGKLDNGKLSLLLELMLFLESNNEKTQHLYGEGEHFSTDKNVLPWRDSIRVAQITLHGL